MSFRLFIYYSALAGAVSALLGWAAGRWLVSGDDLLNQGVKGMVLAVAVALALSLVDGLWNSGLGRPFSLLARVICAVSVGAMAGLLGGLVGESLYGLAPWGVFVVFGYVLVGTLVGASLGLFDLLAALLTNRAVRGAVRKVRSGVIGGTLGGLVGGALSWAFGSAWGQLFLDRDRDMLWSPSAAAFAALGFFLGLLIGLTQVILKQAWLRVEKGFRSGRELILTREEITIGRAESCDVGLFGDPDVEKLHARITRGSDDYVLTDAGTPAGTYLNGERIGGPRPLAAGDVIRVGRCVLRFEERTKR
jgi:hypothetical protein